MFSVVSVFTGEEGEGSNVTITHDALNFTVQFPAGQETPLYSQPPSGDKTSLYRCPTPVPLTPQKLTSGGYALKRMVGILLECFLVYIIISFTRVRVFY